MLSLYFNWSSRFIPVRRRQVFRSGELGGNAEYAKHRDDIERLLAKITVGADLTPHLSARIDVAYEVDKGGRLRGRALDLLLTDWNVHHLHFGHDLRPDGRFVERPPDKPELLFAIFRPDAAYALGVFKHKEWTRDEIVQIAVRNWPDRGLFLRLGGMDSLESPITPDERQAIRDARGNAPIEVDGKLYMGLNTISTAGPSSGAVAKGDDLRGRLDAYRRDEDLLVADMKAHPDNMGRRIPFRPSFEVVEAPAERGYGFGLRERKSGATLWLA